VLVIDDSVNTGSQMDEVQSKLSSNDFDFEIDYGAVYVSKNGRRYVDYWGEVVKYPRVFEWNILYHSKLENACVDIDGILCRDPKPAENDDGEKYKDFIKTVDPLIKPSREIKYLVTCRLEKYREETKEWLRKNGINYQNLIMMDLPDMETRQRLNNHAEYKANVYEETGTEIFIESSRQQAIEIAKITGKPVFCYENGKMFHGNPDTVKKLSNKTRVVEKRGREYFCRFLKHPFSFSKSAVSYLRKSTIRKCRQIAYNLKNR
jgi:orotate phosphoribosyltransferase